MSNIFDTRVLQSDNGYLVADGARDAIDRIWQSDPLRSAEQEYHLKRSGDRLWPVPRDDQRVGVGENSRTWIYARQCPQRLSGPGD